MGLLSKFKYYLRARAIRRKARERAYEDLALSPGKYARAIREIDCIIGGHKWSTEFEPKKDMNSTGTSGRRYCKHCGVYYHTHKYKDLNN